jgi:predicted lipoprotein with Yx(FWY)xxD motif
MRKSGWAAAGTGSLVLLLAACGGSSGSTTAGGTPAGGSSSSQGTSASSGSSGQAAASSPASGSSGAAGGSTPTGSASAHQSAAPKPSSGSDVSFFPQGTTVMVVEHTNLGYVLGLASGQVVYTYAHDTKNGQPTCTGTCAAHWPPVTGTPKAGPADQFPGTFGVVRGAGGVEQITYDGMPLYTYKGALPHTTTGNGVGGVWHVIPLSASDITSG